MTVSNPFTTNYLFTSPTTTPPPAFGVLTAGFVLLFLLGLFCYWRRARMAPDNPPLRRMIRRTSKAAMWCGGIGIFLAVMRYLEVLYLSMPIWLYLLILAMIATVGYFVYEVSERYPIAVWQLQQSHVQRQYRPQTRKREAGRARPVRPAGQKGKGRRR